MAAALLEDDVTPAAAADAAAVAAAAAAAAKVALDGDDCRTRPPSRGVFTAPAYWPLIKSIISPCLGLHEKAR